MNKSDAVLVDLEELDKFFPKWWIEMFDISMRIIKHNDFLSFKKLEQFIIASLTDIPKFDDDKKDKQMISRILVKCRNKGEHDDKIYVTIDIFAKMFDNKLYKISKLIRASKRKEYVCD